MKENKQLVYFTVDNWSPGVDYPRCDNFENLYREDLDAFAFIDNEYCKENKLAVYCTTLDMSIAFTVVAPIGWCVKNSPEIIGSYWDETAKPGKNNWKESIYGLPYPEYKEKNFKCKFIQYNGNEPVLSDE